MTEGMFEEFRKMYTALKEHERKIELLTVRSEQVQKELTELKETLVEGATILPDDFP